MGQKAKDVSCVGIIMDGNRRWAKERGLPTLEGHRRGYQKLEEVVVWAKEASLEHLVVYAFSTENWNRSKDEVTYLMRLFNEMVKEWGRRAHEEQVRLRFIGQCDRFDAGLQEGMRVLEEETKRYKTLTVAIAISYGGRAEVLDAINKIDPVKLGAVTEESLRALMWTHDIPDPDVIIRTGGEQRLSNFLMWQSVYSELFFVDAFWPDFSRKDFDAIIQGMNERSRRFGS